MVIVGPAVGFGFWVVAFVAFAAGWIVTRGVVSKIAERKKGPLIMRRRTPTDRWIEVKRPGRLSEKAIDEITYIGGGIAAVLGVFLLVFVGREWPIATWYGLTAIGFFAGLLTFLLK